MTDGRVDITGTYPLAGGRATVGVGVVDNTNARGAVEFEVKEYVDIKVSGATSLTLVTGATRTSRYTATGGTAPYTFALTGTNPSWVTITNGVFTATPTSRGTFTANIRVSDADGAEKDFSISLRVISTSQFGVGESQPLCLWKYLFRSPIYLGGAATSSAWIISPEYGVSLYSSAAYRNFPTNAKWASYGDDKKSASTGLSLFVLTTAGVLRKSSVVNLTISSNENPGAALSFSTVSMHSNAKAAFLQSMFVEDYLPSDDDSLDKIIYFGSVYASGNTLRFRACSEGRLGLSTAALQALTFTSAYESLFNRDFQIESGHTYTVHAVAFGSTIAPTHYLIAMTRDGVKGVWAYTRSIPVTLTLKFTYTGDIKDIENYPIITEADGRGRYTSRDWKAVILDSVNDRIVVKDYTM